MNDNNESGMKNRCEIPDEWTNVRKTRMLGGGLKNISC
jgi:hypothetical protein